MSAARGPGVPAAVDCARMSAADVDDARGLLGAFLADDEHYLASAAAYGDGGAEALARALDLFVRRPEVGFVWLARARGGGGRVAVGACVACYAISTSRGGIVVKLDDVTIRDGWQGRGVGSAMLKALARHLRYEGVSRIDTACHRDNRGAWRYYERLGFRPLDEERISWLI